jgi:hypothetical protein
MNTPASLFLGYDVAFPLRSFHSWILNGGADVQLLSQLREDTGLFPALDAAVAFQQSLPVDIPHGPAAVIAVFNASRQTL